MIDPLFQENEKSPKKSQKNKSFGSTNPPKRKESSSSSTESLKKKTPLNSAVDSPKKKKSLKSTSSPKMKESSSSAVESPKKKMSSVPISGSNEKKSKKKKTKAKKKSIEKEDIAEVVNGSNLDDSNGKEYHQKNNDSDADSDQHAAESKFESGETKINGPSPLTEKERNKIMRNAREYLNANIRLISACQDEQQTSDCSNVLVRFGLRESIRGSQAFGKDGGACTSVLLKTLYEYHNYPGRREAPKWIDLLHEIRDELTEKGYKQVPALTSSRPLSLQDEFNIIPKNCNGNRKALIIGIGYKGTPWELPGTHNDCWSMIKYLKKFHGFCDEDITILMDDGCHTSPTRANIVSAFHRFAISLSAGDAAFFHFAGHGSSTKDISGDEKSGLDQTLLPVDVKENGDIVDDEIFRILLIPLPRGLEFTAVVDCCHSGTIFDLPFEYIGNSKYEDGDGDEMELRQVTFPHMKMVRAERHRIQLMRELKTRASVIERQVMKAPLTNGKRVNPLTLATIDERPISLRSMLKPVVPVEEEEEEAPEMHDVPKGQTSDNAGLMLFGCLLLCLNPMKLFRSIR